MTVRNVILAPDNSAIYSAYLAALTENYEPSYETSMLRYMRSDLPQVTFQQSASNVKSVHMLGEILLALKS